MEVVQKIKNRAGILSSSPTSGYLFRGDEIIFSRDPCIPMFLAALFIVVKMQKQPKFPSVGEQIKMLSLSVSLSLSLSLSLTHTHTHTHTQEYFSAMRKKEILPFVMKQMNLEDIMLSEINQRRERQILDDITYVWNLEKSELMETEQMVFSRDLKMREMRKCWLKGTNFSVMRLLMYSIVIMVKDIVLYTGKLLRE